MIKAVLQTIAVSPLLLLLASACDDPVDVGAESPATANTPVESSKEPTGGDVPAPVDGPQERHQQPGDVDNGDPWLAQLEHVWVGEADTGYAIVGYDSNDVEIGRIRVYSTGPDSLRMTHEYSGPCWTENPGEDPSEDCADVFDLAISFADPPDEHWHNAYQTLPDNLVMQRMQALMIKAGEVPQPFVGKHLKCALTIAGSAAACLGTAPSIGPGIAVCGAGTLASLCGCKAQLEKLFPKLDMDKVCDPKL